MKKYKPYKHSLNWLRLVAFLLLMLVVFGLKYLLIALQAFFPDYFTLPKITLPEIVIWALILTLAVIYVIYILIFLPLWFKSLDYSVSAEEIVSKTGFINKNTYYMKISAVQYVTVIRTVFSKFTGFNFVVVSAHGGRLVFVLLSINNAEEMAGRIRKYMKSIDN